MTSRQSWPVCAQSRKTAPSLTATTALPGAAASPDTNGAVVTSAASAPNDSVSRQPEPVRRQVPKRSSRMPAASRPSPSRTTRSRSAKPCVLDGTFCTVHCEPSPETHARGAGEIVPVTAARPTTVQVVPSWTTSSAVVSVFSPLARAGSWSTSRKSSASPPATQAAPPLLRLPAMTQPAGPPAIRLTLSAWEPPYSSKEAGTSCRTPSSRSRQVAVRGLPWAPPDFVPIAATRPSRQATEYRIARWE
ncbi:hypothetical protein ACVW00_000705 [Marmoricola sp. URHA0025 HA25]